MPRSHNVKKLPPFATYFDAPPLLKYEPIAWKRRQRSLQVAMVYLNAAPGEFGQVIGSLPTPVKHEIALGPPRPVDQSTVSAWLRGRDKMPLARLGAAVAILEFLLIKYDQAVAEQSEPDPSVIRRLDLAREHIDSLTADPHVELWLTTYRDLIAARLELDRTKSVNDEKLFLAYHDAIEATLAGKKSDAQ